MLVAGEIDAAIGAGAIDLPQVKPLFAGALEIDTAWFKKTGIYPINHIVVVKSELAASHPWLLGEPYKAFKTA